MNFIFQTPYVSTTYKGIENKWQGSVTRVQNSKMIRGDSVRFGSARFDSVRFGSMRMHCVSGEHLRSICKTNPLSADPKLFYFVISKTATSSSIFNFSFCFFLKQTPVPSLFSMSYCVSLFRLFTFSRIHIKKYPSTEFLSINLWH